MQYILINISTSVSRFVQTFVFVSACVSLGKAVHIMTHILYSTWVA